MLAELTIRDFAIIEDLHITWGPGLNVLTGETGAGKSIIVDAVGALLGDRLGPEVVRAGQPRAQVEGIFIFDAQHAFAPGLRALLEEQGLLDDDDQLILGREISRSGRSVARLNGRAVPVALLQQVGEHLVDVHGQSQHLSLLRAREHLGFLDRFAGLSDLRRSAADLYHRWRGVQVERQKLLDEIRVAERERDLLRHEVAEIESADPREGEEEQLAAARQRLRNIEHLRAAAEHSLMALQGDDERRGAVDLLAEAALQSADAGRSDDALRSLAESLDRLATETDETARDLRHYLDQLEADPRQLEELEGRFLLLADLKRKYGENVPAVLEYLRQARRKLDTAEQGEALLAQLDQREPALRAELALAARNLSEQRYSAASKLSNAVERELADLALTGAIFVVSLDCQPDPRGLDWTTPDGGSTRVAIDATGVDRAEFLLSANAGQPPRGLGRIASGGELARVSLALKAVLSRVDPRASLIFDEIDVGVGGRTAPVVGQKLWELTRSHQVLCITHLPQVAAYADQHFVVAKRAEDGATRTAVDQLAARARIAELAAMLGATPASPAATANARELLTRSEAWKSTHCPSPAAAGEGQGEGC